MDGGRLCGGFEAGTCSCAEYCWLRRNDKIASYGGKTEQVVLVDIVTWKKNLAGKIWKLVWTISVTFIPCTNTKVVSEAMMLGTKSGSAEPTKFSFPSPLIHAILIVCDTEHCPEVRKRPYQPLQEGIKNSSWTSSQILALSVFLVKKKSLCEPWICF